MRIPAFVTVAVFLLSLSGLSLAASKPTVAVRGIQLSAQNISCEGWRRDCMRSLGEGFRAMLETAIIKTRKMDVMERQQWGSVVEERGLGQMGMTTSGGTVKGLKGVDYNVYGTITKFGFKKSGFNIRGGSGVTSLLPGRVGRALSSVGSKEVETEDGRGYQDYRCLDGQYRCCRDGGSFGEAGFIVHRGRNQTGFGRCGPVRRCSTDGAARIAEVLVTARIPVKVIAVQKDGTLILNYGNVFLVLETVWWSIRWERCLWTRTRAKSLVLKKLSWAWWKSLGHKPSFPELRLLENLLRSRRGSTLKRVEGAKKDGEERERSGSNW